jgi:uncharacterized protein (TIGR03435 family)
VNVMQILSLQPWVERLGWTLVHFLWQGLSIAVLYAVLRSGIAGKATPKTRYLLACGALAAMMSAPLVTWGLLRSSDAKTEPVHQIRSTPPTASSTGVDSIPIVTLPAAVRDTVSSVRQALFLPWVVVLWFFGAAAFWVRLVGGWVVASRMQSILVRRAPPEWQEILGKLGLRIGLSRPVRLLVSAIVQVPMAVGWLRPVVLVPVGALGGLPTEHLEALLLHELAHIRRHDYLVNILQSVAEALLFYHPAVWWVSGHIRAERELCCDDIAVSVSGDAMTYARALAQLESYRPAHIAPAVAASGGSLPDRIARLLGQTRPNVRSGLGPGVFAVAVLLIAAAYGLLAQTAAQPAFRSVSIRRNASKWSERAQHPMGMGVNSSLLLLIQFAYATHSSPYLGHTIPLPASQVAGGPPWINTEGWDIATQRPPGEVDQDLRMWQTLLADRFKLRVHREIRELPIYLMTAATGGFKLPAPPKDVGCVSFPTGTKPHQVPGKVDCGYVSGPGFSGNAPGELGMRGRKVHMADLISELALILDRPISDRTGFTDEFDVDLNFAPDQALQGFGVALGHSPAPRPSIDGSIPNIFGALEQQLGLKLTLGNGPVEVLVIDHAERPTEN